jgi:hypothetical protein
MFKPLRAILKSLASTLGTLTWSIVMLVIVLFLFSLILVIRVTSFLQEEPDQRDIVVGLHGETVVETVEATYGSVGLGLLHLFMCVTGGHDWSVYYDPLKPTGEINCIIFLFFIVFTQISVLNIILGIFVDDAMKNLLSDKEEKALEHADEQRQLSDTLREICQEIDVGGDGKITTEEFNKAVTNAKFKNFLETMDFKASELRDLLNILCSGKYTEGINIEAFVSLCMRFRGPASCMDMQMVLGAIGEVRESIASRNVQ